MASVVLCAAASSGLACQTGYTMYPAVQGCADDAGPCGSPGGGVSPGAGGSTGASTSASVGGATAASDLVGGIDILSAPNFEDTGAAYEGAANVVALAGGGTITAMFAGGSGATFELTNVPAGNSWILVQDTSGGSAGIVSTYSGPWGTPNASPITLPVLGSELLPNIASDLQVPLTGGVSSLGAQVVLLVTHGGAPYEGLAVSGGAGSATVAYDNGPGSYTDTATATSTGGSIILFNLGTTGATTLSLMDTATMAVFPVTVQTAAGAATLVSLGL